MAGLGTCQLKLEPLQIRMGRIEFAELGERRATVLKSARQERGVRGSEALLDSPLARALLEPGPAFH
jgi:hypothetical protein